MFRLLGGVAQHLLTHVWKYLLKSFRQNKFSTHKKTGALCEQFAFDKYKKGIREDFEIWSPVSKQMVNCWPSVLSYQEQGRVKSLNLWLLPGRAGEACFFQMNSLTRHS